MVNDHARTSGEIIIGFSFFEVISFCFTPQRTVYLEKFMPNYNLMRKTVHFSSGDPNVMHALFDSDTSQNENNFEVK